MTQNDNLGLLSEHDRIVNVLEKVDSIEIPPATKVKLPYLHASILIKRRNKGILRYRAHNWYFRRAMRSTWCPEDAYSRQNDRDASHDAKDHVVLLVNKHNNSVALQLFVHIIDIHNDYYDENSPNYAECRKEIEFAFYMTYHGYAALLVEAGKILSLVVNGYANIGLPHKGHFLLLAMQGA